MAGSNKWFIYTADSGTEYAIQADESNVEAVNGTDKGWTVGTNIAAVPRNYRPRFAAYQSADGNRVIKIPIMTQADYNTINEDHPTITDPIAGTGNLTLAWKRPELIRLPKANDTGITDGDNP